MQTFQIEHVIGCWSFQESQNKNKSKGTKRKALKFLH